MHPLWLVAHATLALLVALVALVVHVVAVAVVEVQINAKIYNSMAYYAFV